MWKVIISMCFVMQLFDVCATRVFPATCGQRVTSSGLITNGEPAKIGQFPWLGVWCHGNTTKKCFCGVNLITTQHVVTAAHCLQNKGNQFPTYWPNTTIHFGRFDLMDDDEKEHSQVRKIIDVFIHDDWKPTSDDYDADIAVLRLDRPVKFNKRIQAVCLPTSTEEKIGGRGLVVSKKQSCF